MPEGAVRAYLAGPLAALTVATNTDPASLLEAIEETRRRGWAINRGELHLEAGALAVPVLDASGASVAALGLNVPLSRLDDDRVRILVAELRAATKRLTPTFGFEAVSGLPAFAPVP